MNTVFERSRERNEFEFRFPGFDDVEQPILVRHGRLENLVLCGLPTESSDPRCTHFSSSPTGDGSS